MAELLREARLPERPPAAAHRDRAAHVLVQRAVRRLPRRAPASARACRWTSTSCSATRSSRSARACSSRGPPRARGSSSTTSGCSRASRATSNFSLDTPWKDLRVDVQDAVLRGENYKVTVQWKNRYGREMRYTSGFEGVVPYIERQYVQAESDTPARSAGRSTSARCRASSCNGDRLKPEVLAVLVHGHSIADASRLSLADAQHYFAQLELTDREAKIAAQVLREIRAASRLPPPGRPQLPEPEPRGRLPLGRRGAAHPPRDADRLGADRRALRARRAVDRPAPARQPPPHRDAPHAPRPRQHAHRRRARRGDHPRGRLDRRHRPAAPASTAATSCTPGRYADLLAETPVASPATTSPGAARSRRPQKRRRIDKERQITVVGARENNLRDVTVDVPARRHDGGHRRQRLRQVVARQRHPLRGARQPAQRRAPRRGQAHAGHRPRQSRQGRARRPGADRPHAALEPGHLHRRLRPHPHAVQRDARGEGARLPARAVQLQRQGRPLRGVLGRRHDQDRDELPARRVRRLRGLPRQALQPRHPRGALQGQEHRRGARDADRRGGRVLRADPGDPPLPEDARRRRARVRPARPVAPRPSPAARRSASSSPPSCSGAPTDAASTCSTSRRRACTSKTSPGCSRCSAASSTRATPSSSSSTTSTSSSRPTGSSTSAPRAARAAARSIATGTPEQVARAEGSHTGAFLADVLGVPQAARKAG